jgi:DNA-binding MarR family transcriptional regulator
MSKVARGRRASELELDGTECCACFNVRKAARAITRLYDSALQRSGVRSTQFTVLVAVAQWGPVSIGALADTLVSDRTTLTRNLRQMQRQGLLEISERSGMRHRFVTLSASGRRALARSLPRWREIQRRFVKEVGASDWSALQSELERLAVAARPLEKPSRERCSRRSRSSISNIWLQKASIRPCRLAPDSGFTALTMSLIANWSR